MRHYYRFMELEPVLEMEEDSVGDDSPTSSSGSPSLSPPPDVWAQLSGREYQDSAYNMLLQDHLDLQRAYRLLEVQYRNCETRAARDVQEATAHVRSLKETLKEVLLSQETDKLLAIKEDLQRVKEKEAKLKEEVYDLREQNELLEFRILELEECHENSANQRETCDVGTQMDAGVVPPVTSPLIDRYNAWIEQGRNLVEITSEARDEESISPRDVADCIQTSTSSLRSVAVPSEQSRAHDTMTRDALNATQHPISCTLCRSVPRRRSLTGTGEAKESLRKSKSDGEIKLVANDDVICSRLSDLPMDQCDGYSEEQVKTMKTLLKAIHDVLKETRVEVECTNSELREEVVTLESVVYRLRKELARRDSGGKEEEEICQPTSSLSSSQLCHCCSQELRPALEDVLLKLQQLTELIDKTVYKVDKKQDNKIDTLVVEREVTELPAAIEEPNASIALADAPVGIPEARIWKEALNSLQNKVNTELALQVDPSLAKADDTGKRVEVRKMEAPVKEKSDSQTKLLIKEIDIDSIVDKSKNGIYNNIMLGLPIPEKNNKPVLRRWNEHLKVRDERTKSWSGHSLDFPKNLQTAVV